MDSRMLNINAHQNPSTLKPGVITPANIIINALITSRNSPKVITVSGIVSQISIGSTKIFRNASIIAITKALQKLLTWIPGSIYAARITANADNNN